MTLIDINHYDFSRGLPNVICQDVMPICHVNHVVKEVFVMLLNLILKQLEKSEYRVLIVPDESAKTEE